MAEIQRAFKFRIYPDSDQEILLTKTFGCARFVWNKLVENFNSYDCATNPKPEVITEKTLKDQEEFSFLREVSAAALQQKRRDFDSFKSQYFNKKRKTKIGRPNFKKLNQRQSFRLGKTRYSLDKTNSSIRIEKIGVVKIVLDRVIPDDAKCTSITVSKEPSGKYYCSILAKVNVEPKPLTGKMVGIDLGLKDLFIFSDGQVTNNPRWFRESQARLKRAQQHLSRKTSGSSRRHKQKVKVARVHEKIRFQRKHFLHETSNALVRDYDVICVEDLNVAGMVKNRNLAKAISDASWSSFVNMLDYKCNWYGKTLVKIDRFYPSTKTCSCCGHKVSKMGLEVRTWACPSCGAHHDRDLNAAKNILAKGFSDLTGEAIAYAEAA